MIFVYYFEKLTYAIDTMSLARCRLLLLEAMETGYSVPLNRESARIDIWKLAAELIALVKIYIFLKPLILAN